MGGVIASRVGDADHTMLRKRASARLTRIRSASSASTKSTTAASNSGSAARARDRTGLPARVAHHDARPVFAARRRMRGRAEHDAQVRTLGARRQVAHVYLIVGEVELDHGYLWLTM